MPYVDMMEQQHLKAVFVRLSLVNDTNNETGEPGWRVAGDGGVNHFLPAATDEASARSEAEAWLTSNGYFQITYWTVISSTTTRCVWVH